MKLPPIEQLLFHAPPMRLIEDVMAFDFEAARITCGAVPREDSVFVRDGKLPAVVALEYMAQAVAAFVTCRRMAARVDSHPIRPRIGYIISVRQFKLDVDHFELGRPLSITASLIWHDASSGSFDCAVHLDAETAASAQILVHEPPAEESAL